ncbi:MULTISPECIES: hypothetical protein [unclassified Brucella]|uniref:hypothetical protein n=1 Tax=unclassified Brucella TaxID=2632610 RepID=UPI0009728D79|nr:MULTISPECIES: hypothetical protein [unclassified Brucella]APX70740.1 hypothetical protein BKD03_16595 [Brucella sp. 09RB8471]MRN76822.1 hypothetical protein [Brucella sp. 10RB9210]
MSSTPILLSWDGEAFYPASPYWASRADRQFVVGETYNLVEHHDRSNGSHNHYFAAVKNGFDNLPDDLRGEYPTVADTVQIVSVGFNNINLLGYAWSDDPEIILRELAKQRGYRLVKKRKHGGEQSE